MRDELGEFEESILFEVNGLLTWVSTPIGKVDRTRLKRGCSQCTKKDLLVVGHGLGVHGGGRERINARRKRRSVRGGIVARRETDTEGAMKGGRRRKVARRERAA